MAASFDRELVAASGLATIVAKAGFEANNVSIGKAKRPSLGTMF